MAARRANFPTAKGGTPQPLAAQLEDDLPRSLPKAPRGLSFDGADRSSVRRLSQIGPLPEPPDAPPDPDDEGDTLLFRRMEPTRVCAAPQSEVRIAPPLPVPPREAVEHPRATRSRAALTDLDASRPQTLRVPVMPRRRRRRGVPWGGLTLLLLAALFGAAVGWWATPHVRAHFAPPTQPH